jgi:serine/threonine-protein kinase
LGQGACGKTVLLYDDIINEYFVCKKYSPFDERNRQELFSNFLREIKLLHQIYHCNVVRVFNYYLYPGQQTGYILMEFVDGCDIDKFISQHPEKTNEVFLQTISGFNYLEMNNILHRDIRPTNIMVCNNGTVKIIDLGFGKQVKYHDDFDKSITLNWWCELPHEFEENVYDFKSEVYFVGKLFQKIITENGISHFKYKDIVKRMCEKETTIRIQSFIDIEKEIQSNLFFEIDFSTQEMLHYRQFSDAMKNHITKIENGTKYIEDNGRILSTLEDAYRSFMLEETAPDCSVIIRCFIDGAYYYRSKSFGVEIVRDFLHLLKSSTQEKIRIIIANLHTKLDAISRYEKGFVDYDDVPF